METASAVFPPAKKPPSVDSKPHGKTRLENIKQTQCQWVAKNPKMF
jgi:hypothetical protein